MYQTYSTYCSTGSKICLINIDFFFISIMVTIQLINNFSNCNIIFFFRHAHFPREFSRCESLCRMEQNGLKITFLAEVSFCLLTEIETY